MACADCISWEIHVAGVESHKLCGCRERGGKGWRVAGAGLNRLRGVRGLDDIEQKVAGAE